MALAAALVFAASNPVVVEPSCEGREEERCGGVDGPSVGGEAGAQLAALCESNPRPPDVACAYPIGGVARRVVFW